MKRGENTKCVAFTTDNDFLSPRLTGKKKKKEGKKKKSVGALGNCSSISTMPQINLDVLHPSGDYMES